MSSEKATAQYEFDQWWARNHPFDWWAKDRKGEPLSHGDRLRVWELCQRAYNDHAAEVGRLREALEKAARYGHAVGGYHSPNFVKFEECKREECITARAALSVKEEGEGNECP